MIIQNLFTIDLIAYRGTLPHLLIKISQNSAFDFIQIAEERAEVYNLKYSFLIGAFF